MTRRLFLFARKKEPETTRAPIDVDRLNAFATAYNAYAEQIRSGRVDLRLWRTVEALWAKLLTTV